MSKQDTDKQPSRKTRSQGLRILTAAEIPTLHELYKQGVLPAAPPNAVVPQTVLGANPGPGGFRPSATLNKKIGVVHHDITCLRVDAIVNPANSYLSHGSGVALAIRNAAGSQLDAACRVVGYVATGDAAVTDAFNLHHCQKVIHAVGPDLSNKGGNFATHELNLQTSYIRSLERAVAGNLRTVAFPCISSGIFRYPQPPVTYGALAAVRDFLETHNNREHVDKIIFVLWSDDQIQNFFQYLPIYFPPTQKELKKATQRLPVHLRHRPDIMIPDPAMAGRIEGTVLGTMEEK
ncbi:hypothetical protein VTJ04DRAFT_4350 [Mycothermus thermophilus]|uniref:uncharacterized protein n=1 Tax=Humicola insolens TaxID=85995 RepID=UPI003743EE9C